MTPAPSFSASATRSAQPFCGTREAAVDEQRVLRVLRASFASLVDLRGRRAHGHGRRKRFDVEGGKFLLASGDFLQRARRD